MERFDSLIQRGHGSAGQNVADLVKIVGAGAGCENAATCDLPPL